MKKLVTILLIAISSVMLFVSATATVEDEIKVAVYNICDLVVQHKEYLARRGYQAEDLYWTSYNRVRPGNDASFQLDFEKNTTYVIYTVVTKDSAINSCLRNDEHKDEETCTNKYKDYAIIFYKAKYTGSHHYIIRCVSGDGVFVSYIIKIINNNKNI